MEQMEEYIGKPFDAMRLVLYEEVYLLKRLLEDLKVTVDELSELVEGRITSIAQDVEALIDAFNMKIDAMTTDVRLLKRTVGSDTADIQFFSSKEKIPEPSPFGGERSAKELENFLWDMKTYFQAAKVIESDKIFITSMFLTDDAKLW
ncbi:hypothetical protein CDL12_30548 [Handroanthus impetiginosus]|uniref:Retrotransposon gag domain-containing protein n=1 Tax=Handroanthus impetiginosus TaxID=429701 RepID=A0A2G9FVM3_9LAMI|nr:hypothetical protein CDL12_30548 [Handroanthus impetiginosus]